MAARSNTASSSLNEALLKNRAVQVITMGNKALICCKYEDLKTMSFRQHSSRYCAVPSCKNFRGKVPSMSFFQFPKDVERCKKWVDFCRRDDLKSKDVAMLFRSGHSICAEHFEDSMFMNPKVRNRLIHCAVPSVFDPTCPPPPLSIKDLSSRISANVENAQIISAEESDLCLFHRKFLKSVSVLDVEMSSIHFCMQCGSAITDVEELSRYVYRVTCKRQHEMLCTVELAAKCREWAVDCHGLDRMKQVTNLNNRCHLCEEHFAPMQAGAPLEEAGTAPVQQPASCVTSDGTVLEEIVDDSGSIATIIQVSNAAGDIKPIEVSLVPLDSSSSVPRNQDGDRTATDSTSAHLPCLPSSFFSIRGFTTHLAKVLGRDIPALSSTCCKLVQTDGTLKSQREYLLYKKVASCRVQICRLKKRIEALEASARKPVTVSAQVLSRELSKYLSGARLRLVQEQLRVGLWTGGGVRWSDDIVTLAKIIRAHSLKAYSILKRIIALPTRSVLRRHAVPSTGLPNLTEFLKTSFSADLCQTPKADDEDVKDPGGRSHLEPSGDVGTVGDGSISEEFDDVLPGDEALKAVEDEVAMEEELIMAAATLSTHDVQSCTHLTPMLGPSDSLQIYEVFAQAAATIQGDSELQMASCSSTITSITQ